MFGEIAQKLSQTPKILNSSIGVTMDGGVFIRTPSDGGGYSTTIKVGKTGSFTTNLTVAQNTNLAIGEYTMGQATESFNNTGSYNLAIGSTALCNLVNGNYNIAIGANSGQNITSAQRNVFVGYNTAGNNNAFNGSDNVLLGYNTGSSLTNSAGGSQILIGSSAVGASNLGSNTIGIGTSISLGGTGTNNIFIGQQCGGSSTTPAGYNIMIGNGVSPASTGTTSTIALVNGASTVVSGFGSQSVYIGGQIMTTGGGGSSSANNVVIGYQGLLKGTSANHNLILGNQVASSTLATGSYNILLGNTNGIDTAGSASSNYLAIGLALDGTTGENGNQANAGIRALGYIAEKNYQIVNAATATVSNASSSVIITGQATCTITTPAAPVDGQIMKISCDGTAVTTFAITGNGGQTVLGAPVALTANTGIGYIYRLSNTTWYRQY